MIFLPLPDKIAQTSAEHSAGAWRTQRRKTYSHIVIGNLYSALTVITSNAFGLLVEGEVEVLRMESEIDRT